MMQTNAAKTTRMVDVAVGVFSALGPILKDNMLSVVVDNAINLPDMCTVTYHDPDRSILTKLGGFAVIGQKLTVLVDAAPLFIGEVTAVELDEDESGTRTIVRGYDRAHRLMRGTKTMTYLNQSYSQIATQIAAAAGIPIGIVQPTPGIQQHVSQANVSDWVFLNWMAAKVGYEATVEQGLFHFRAPTPAATAPPPGSHSVQLPMQLIRGQNLLRLHATLTAGDQVVATQALAWDPVRKTPSAGSAPAQTQTAWLAARPNALAAMVGGKVHVETNTPHKTPADVQSAAKAAAERIASSFAELDGLAVGDPLLRAGRAVSLGEVGPPFEGKFSLTSTKHVYDPSEGYRTWFTVSGLNDRSLLGLTSVGGNNVAQAGAGPRISGVVPGIVLDTRDPMQAGRVRVRFPWLSPTYVSDWAPVCHAGAGMTRGLQCPYEVNDQVLVAFEQGDIRSPYVVGGLYSIRDRRPLSGPLYDASGLARGRVLASRAGHQIALMDDPTNLGIEIRSADKKLEIVLDQATGAIKIAANGGQVTVEASGPVNVESKASAQVTAPTVKVEAKGAAEVTAATVKIESQGLMEIKAAGPLMLKGTPIQLN